MKEITIAIVEDHVLMRQGVISLLREYEHIEVLFDVSNGQELLRMLKVVQPDIILIDIDMPLMGGREALQNINKQYPQISVIMLSVHYMQAYIVEFIKEGAKAFLPKEAPIEEVVKAIVTVAVEGQYYSVKVLEYLAQDASRKEFTISNVKLTRRETEILNEITLHKSTEEIANTFCISRRTVEWHIENLKKKSGSKSLRDLNTWGVAREQSLIK